MRREKSETFTMLNLLLGDGEEGIEWDTRRRKVGDGSTRWNDLPYLGPTAAVVNTAVTSTDTTLANLTELAASVVKDRQYFGELVLFASCPTAADGLKLDFDGGSATMTSFAAGVVGNVQGATLGANVSAALATDVIASALNGTGVNAIVVKFGFVASASGTLIPRVAKNADAAGATLTIAAGSHLSLSEAV